MQLLIVHDDAEVGEQLAGMVADYTSHQCDLVANDAAALHWAQTHAEPAAGKQETIELPSKRRGFFVALRRS